MDWPGAKGDAAAARAYWIQAQAMSSIVEFSWGHHTYVLKAPSVLCAHPSCLPKEHSE